jgi:hypothetical protein
MNDDDDLSANAAWQAYQNSIRDKYRDTLAKAIYETKLDATLKATSLEDTVKEYELDKLFGVTPTLGPAISRASITGNTIMGKKATTVIYDDPWDI